MDEQRKSYIVKEAEVVTLAQSSSRATISFPDLDIGPEWHNHGADNGVYMVSL